MTLVQREEPVLVDGLAPQHPLLGRQSLVLTPRVLLSSPQQRDPVGQSAFSKATGTRKRPGELQTTEEKETVNPLAN